MQTFWYRLTSVVLENGHLTSVVLVIIIYSSWKRLGLGVGIGVLDLVFVSDGTGLLTSLCLSLCSNGHFPGGPGLVNTRMPQF